VAPGIVGLTPTQNLLILGVIVTFDSHFQRKGKAAMLDIIFIGATALFVIVAVFYVRACEKLRGAKL
jgi:dolichyl-phosphate-mannose--protein O-mannosyl transferase